MNNYSKGIRLIVVMCMVVSVVMTPISQVRSMGLNLEVDTPRTAKVIEVIDGEVIRVLYYYSDFVMPEIKVIKMIGIDTQGSDDAYAHTLSSLLGQVVFLVEEDNSDFPEIAHLDVTYAYVYHQMNKTMNEDHI